MTRYTSMRFYLAKSKIPIALLIYLQLFYTSKLNSQHVYSPNRLKIFESFIYADQHEQRKALQMLKQDWNPGYVHFIPELIHYTENGLANLQLLDILQSKTGQQYGRDFFSWMEWLWQSPEIYPYFYFDFKANLYKHIDPKFEAYFAGRYEQSSIRIDEVLWGGVRQDGIPPLRYPKMIPSRKADYLAESDVVFGMVINNIPKAYPKRILGWHEMVVDKFGKMDVAGVYCTLCGTMIAYNLEFDGVKHDLGTSGFLYRSNKLMYDRDTQSLWSTIDGEPVLGPLVDQGIKLETYSVNTTTWGEWRALHPNTQVLSMETGHQRDYSEGAAYQSYFATDDLMFPVAHQNPLLQNKQEVLIVRTQNYEDDPLAISIDFLKRKGIHQDWIGAASIVVLMGKDGMARAYNATSYQFQKFKNGVLVDDEGRIWQVHSDRLQYKDGTILERIPSHRIFWFAWLAAYPDTRLVK